MGRKIDDDVLLDMISQGREQKEAAAYFGVSPAAICKRLKRLQSGPDAVLEKYHLTDKEKAFCIAKAQGKTNTEAALASYEAKSRETAKAIGSQLMGKENIKLAIGDLFDKHRLSMDDRVSVLSGHVYNRDPNISLKALDQTWKLDGSYAPDKHDRRENSFT